MEDQMGPRKISPSERVEGAYTQGMLREQAVHTSRVWSGLVKSEPSAVSGWHHHGDHESVIFVLAGSIRIEFGPGGESHVEGGPGDFIFVPPAIIHREATASPETAHLIVFRSGAGEPVFNVGGPEG